MPYKSEKKGLLIPNDYDARAKLTTEERQEIYDLYKTGKWSQRQLARKFGVSRRLITFYVDPKRLERTKIQQKERQKGGRYYSKEKHREYIKKHRKYKRQLFEEDKLIDRRS